MLEIVISAIYFGFWAIVTLCNYKIYSMDKTCTIAAKGLFTDLKLVGGFRTHTFTGKVSYKTEKGKIFSLNYKKGVFERLPVPYTGLFAEPKEVTVMYDPKDPSHYYIKDGYWGKTAVILPAIISLIYPCFAVCLRVFIYFS